MQKAKYETIVAKAAKQTFRIMGLPKKIHWDSSYLSPCL